MRWTWSWSHHVGFFCFQRPLRFNMPVGMLSPVCALCLKLNLEARSLDINSVGSYFGVIVKVPKEDILTPLRASSCVLTMFPASQSVMVRKMKMKSKCLWLGAKHRFDEMLPIACHTARTLSSGTLPPNALNVCSASWCVETSMLMVDAVASRHFSYTGRCQLLS